MLTLIKGTPITAIAWKKEKQFNNEVDVIFEKKSLMDWILQLKSSKSFWSPFGS